MTSEEIKEGNQLISNFMGVKLFGKKGGLLMDYLYFDPTDNKMATTLKYHSSWDWLMPACKKWDDLYKTDEPTGHTIKYIELSDLLDSSVSLQYNIKDPFEQLVENIKWYNEINKK